MAGNDTITISSLGSFIENGYLSGRIRNVQNLNSAGTSYEFGKIGAVVSYSGVSPGTTTIVRNTGTTASGLTQALKRYFDISASTNSGLNITLKFNYRDPIELNGQTESNLKLWKRPAGFVSWQKQSSSVVNTVNDTV